MEYNVSPFTTSCMVALETSAAGAGVRDAGTVGVILGASPRVVTGARAVELQADSSNSAGRQQITTAQRLDPLFMGKSGHPLHHWNKTDPVQLLFLKTLGTA